MSIPGEAGRSGSIQAGAAACRLLDPAARVSLGVSGPSWLAVPGDTIAAAAAGGQEGQHPFEPGPVEEGEGSLGGSDRPYPCRRSR